MSAAPHPVVIEVPSPAESGTRRVLSLELTVTDPDVIVELERRSAGRERDELALSATRIGILALRTAAGAVDADAIRHEGERILASFREVLAERTSMVNESIAKVLAQYFDPASGAVPARLEQLTKRDGELERVLGKFLDGDQSAVARTLAAHVGTSSPIFKLLSPQQSDGLIAVLTNTIEAALKQQRDAVLEQFSLDRKGSALSRLVEEVTTANGRLKGDLSSDVAKVVSEFSLDNKNGALSRLVGRVESAQKTIVEQLSLDHQGSALSRLSTMLEKTSEAVEGSLTLDVETSPLARLRRELSDVLDKIAQSNAEFQAEVRTTLETFKVRREEEARGPRHGVVFEDAVGDFIRDDAQRAGDVHEAVGTKQGRAGRKVGDHVVTLGPESAAPGARIVYEAKANKSYTEADALAEIGEARKNREAVIGVLVFERSSAPDGLETFRRVGQDILVVWDPEDPITDVYLRAALTIARALAFRDRAEHARSSTSLRGIDTAVRELSRHAATLDDIVKAARAIKNKGQSVLDAAEEMRDALGRQVGSLRQHVASLRGELERDG